MLASIRIRNLALVEELSWSLSSGFIAVTGETGSGKSIIVGALKLILGERADKSLIRSGADSCTVEALFHATDTVSLNAWLEEQGVEPCEDGHLIIKRVISTSGSGRQFINGSPTTLAVLAELGEGLVDLHGPHDHQSLLSAEKQMELLDAFAGADALRARFIAEYREMGRLKAEHGALAGSEAALERELDLLRHQVAEITDAALQLGEEEEVLARYTIASNARKLIEVAGAALGRLSEDEESALARLSETARLLRELERTDPASSRFGDALQRGLVEIEELSRDLRRYVDEIEADPGALGELEERVNLIQALRRKYGGSVAEIIAFGETAAARLAKIEGRGEELERLAAQIKIAHAAMVSTAAKLGEKRAAAAPKLAKAVASHLTELGFKKSGFTVELFSLPEPGPHGGETVEFVFAPNPGEPAKPLRAIASSGEISRVMLALKSALAAQDRVALLVFDEIDANVGGEIARAVGARMRAIAKERQVLAITHLPQVAACAGTQFIVSKAEVGGRTVSRLEEVVGAARELEIARMLGGGGSSALAHAKTLLSGEG